MRPLVRSPAFLAWAVLSLAWTVAVGSWLASGWEQVSLGIDRALRLDEADCNRRYVEPDARERCVVLRITVREGERSVAALYRVVVVIAPPVLGLALLSLLRRRPGRGH